MMKIELDNVWSCVKCGILFDYTKFPVTIDTDFQRSKIYNTKCPVCKTEEKVFE